MSNGNFEMIKEDHEIDAAITEAETEYVSEGQLIDAREALSQLKKTYFGNNNGAEK